MRWRRRVGVSLVRTILLLPIAFDCLYAQVQDKNWSDPIRITSADGNVKDSILIGDGHGVAHAFWVEERYFENRTLVMYCRLESGSIWSAPVMIYEDKPTFPGNISGLDITVDPQDTLHLVWEGNSGPVYYSKCPAIDALNRASWSKPVKVDVKAHITRIRIGKSGMVHLVCSTAWGDHPDGVFYTRSADGGKSWSKSQWLDPAIPSEYSVDNLQCQLDSNDGLHVVWDYFDRDNAPYSAKWVLYSQSLDGGQTWLPPWTVDKADDKNPDLLRGATPNLAVYGQSVHIVWTGGSIINVGRRHRYSADLGRTWSDIAQLFGDLHGSAAGDGFLFDNKGVLHFMAQIRYPQGVYHASWVNGKWSDPSLVYLIIKDWTEPMGDRIHAHGVRLAKSPEDQLFTAFTNCGPCGDGSIYQGNRMFFAMNTRQPTLFFSHVADGGGYSMRFVLNNLSDNALSSKVRAYAADGRLQELTFESGVASEVPVALPPHSTVVLDTLGTSDSVKTGYVTVEFDKNLPVGGTAIFKFDSGLEASVLPTSPGRKFALFVERDATFDTGIALLRMSGSIPVGLKLYDSGGKLAATGTWDFSGNQQAKFLHELFDIPQTFRGLLVLESDGDIAPLGLRFGDRVRSTIPVANWTSPTAANTFYFPQFADGSGWSMLISSSNLSDTPAAGRMSFYNSNGSSQPVPFGSGSSAEVALPLQPRATQVLTTAGSSSPLIKGYVKVDMGQNQSTGVAVFKFGSGLEASVLPTQAGKRFALFVERSAVLETGIAVMRLSTQPVQFDIYDSKGNLLQSGAFPITGSHDSKFVSEFAKLPQDFVGLLLLRSAGDFATVGLRFGNGVLSTLPVSTY